MARRPRLLVPGLPLHIIQRGNNRSVCFYSEDDYIFYIHLLKLLSETHGCKIHLGCLMTNHVHLLLTPTSPLSACSLMNGLGQRYVQNENRGQTTITAKTYIGGLTPIFSRSCK
ncbi:transposase [Pseudomonas trivialis]|uniref:transposase n=1 Tax=Pseudomonas trivialis TaxID=200450 RepID=UPI001F3D7894|nr:transposase [Pseudomonas trivialis]